MSRQQTLINEIRERLNELESLLNPTTLPTPTVEEPPNFQLSDSILRMNETVFKITPTQRIELCEFISTTQDTKINIKRFIDKEEPSRCICYCLVKEIERREKFMSEGENLYYDESKNKYYSQCRMPCIKDNNNNCNRHTASPQIDVSRMKILTNSSYNLLLDQSIKDYCKMYLSSSSESEAPTQPQIAPSPKPAPVAPATKPAPINKVPVAPATKPAPINKVPVAPATKPAPINKAPVAAENSDIESASDSENESSSSSDSEVDMIVSKVSESLKSPPTEESGSEQEDSDDCMLDADEIHDEEGNTYYIDEAKSVIKLDEEGYGERLGMLKEFKSGNLFYKNKRWKIEYFPKK